MAFQFSQARDYEPGMLFLGLDDRNRPKGIETERHAITVAGSGAGKGVALIIPNLLRWLSSAVVIDPKGENAERTWQARRDMGQLVGVVDPFHEANVPPELRVSINPLATVDPDSLTARADIQAIADGLFVRYKSEDGMWDNGATAVIAGVIAYVIGTAPPEHRTLTTVRRILLQPDGLPEKDKEPTDLYADALRMTAFTGCGGLTVSVGRTLIKALTDEKGTEKHFLSAALEQTAWIDDPAHAAVLGSSTFDLAALKTGKATLYLVIPPKFLDTQGAFLRLFVRTALNVMAQGNRAGGKCLFLLDEFFSLGRLDIIAKAAGLMRSYGVQLWPFLQDLGQLTSLYGGEGSATFFANSDAQIFFGLSDIQTLNHLSERLGVMTRDDIPKPDFTEYLPLDMEKSKSIFPHVRHEQYGKAFFNKDVVTPQRERQEADWRHMASTLIGKPRLPPDMLASLTGKPDGKDVAENMVVVGRAGRFHLLRLAPYFMTFKADEDAKTQPKTATTKTSSDRTQKAVLVIGIAVLAVIASVAALPNTVGPWALLTIFAITGDRLIKLFKPRDDESPV